MSANRDTLVRVARAGILTGLSDGLFASVLSVLDFHSTVTRVWQGVASTLLGRSALDGRVGSPAEAATSGA
jgi:hypothetical protein